MKQEEKKIATNIYDFKTGQRVYMTQKELDAIVDPKGTTHESETLNREFKKYIKNG